MKPLSIRCARAWKSVRDPDAHLAHMDFIRQLHRAAVWVGIGACTLEAISCGQYSSSPRNHQYGMSQRQLWGWYLSLLGIQEAISLCQRGKPCSSCCYDAFVIKAWHFGAGWTVAEGPQRVIFCIKVIWVLQLVLQGHPFVVCLQECSIVRHDTCQQRYAVIHRSSARKVRDLHEFTEGSALA